MASRTPSQISSDILAKLAVTAPGLSLEVGTPERKIIDAVAEALAENQIDNYLNSTALDIDTKSGADLEDYVAVFGFGRLQGKYATGEVVVVFDLPAVQSYVIPAGTQFTAPATSTQASLTFASTSQVIFNVADKLAVVPLQCTTIGTVGNVAASSISGFSSGFGFSSVNNISSFSNGTDNETDEQLRTRFKKTILRNIAGTEDFYTAICLQIAANGQAASTGVSRVKVLGPVAKYGTQVQTNNINITVALTSKNCKYVWAQGEAVSENIGQITTTLVNISAASGSTALSAPTSSFDSSMVGSFISGPGIVSGATLTSVTDSMNATMSVAATASATITLTVSGETWYTNGVDYIFSSGAISAPAITPISATAANSFLDVSYEYTSTNSRNNPVNGITNKVDIFVDGTNPQAVQEIVVWSNQTINNIPGSPYYAGNFATSNGTAVSLVGKVFSRFGSTPILTWPTTLYSGSVAKTLNTDYVGVYDITTNQSSDREMSGIVWLNSPPTPGVANSVNYTFNQTPQVLQAIFKKQKQITTDVLVHQATTRSFGFVFVIQYNQGSAVNAINIDVTNAVNRYFNQLPFGAWIQLSDILQVAHNVNGVDNVRMAHFGDGTGVQGGIYEYKNGAVSQYFTSDFQLQDNQLAALYVPQAGGGPLYSSMFIRRTFSTFGS